MLRRQNDESVRGQIVADLAVGEPGAAKAMRKDNDWPFLLCIQLGFLYYWHMNTATANKAKQRGKSSLWHPVCDLSEHVKVFEFASGGPTGPPKKSKLFQRQESFYFFNYLWVMAFMKVKRPTI